MLPIFPLQGFLDEEGDLFWIEDLSFFERTMRAPPNSFQNYRNLFLDNVLADLLMVGSESGKILFIEEMAEGSVPDIMQ
jgi:hypothetical protein